MRGSHGEAATILAVGEVEFERSDDVADVVVEDGSGEGGSVARASR